MTAFFKFFTSLRLTVVTLSMALVLVFIGTLAQVKMGLFLAQEKYFSSIFVFWSPEGASWKIPVWPGGYLLGAILLLNLVAAQIQRFSFTKKKLGIYITHLGLIFMFVGQFTTQLLQVESFMSLRDGETKNYSESSRRNELAIVDVTDPKIDKVVVIPERLLAETTPGHEIRVPELPFGIKVDSYYLNSNWQFQPGKGLSFEPLPRSTKMNDRDIPSATIQPIVDGTSKGQFTVSNWLVEERLADLIQANLGPGAPTTWAGPKRFSNNGHEYLLMMRPTRYYKPFSLSLLKFSHDRYLGTDMPKNFSSRVRLQKPATGEDRELLIYMNNPLRYGGETYYQASFLRDDSGNDFGTILQVVRNPSWLTPYIACVMVGAGLIIQFLSHLIGFAKKRTA